MLTIDQLRELDIQAWADLSGKFEDADLLLGNGFSINFSAEYRYASLFEEFLKECDKNEQRIFQAFKTTNFEAIQQKLLSAIEVNNIFEKPNDNISNSVNKLRNGLIKSVRNKHPHARDISKDKIFFLSSQIEFFNDIYTLNYDLHLYHIIMNIYEKYSYNDYEKKFQDYFWDRINDDYIGFMDEQCFPYKDIFYLHGALFLFSGYNRELKIRRTENFELIERVSKSISEGNMPLFVSEGNSREKLRVIRHNAYLNFALAHFRDCSEQLVIYGASLSDQDQHIIDAINEKQHKIAISIYIGDKDLNQVDSEIRDFQSRLYRSRDKNQHEITFFNSETLFQYTPSS